MEDKNILPINKILHGDALLELAKFPDQSVDLLCTDPPYGYSFMNKDWDKAIASLDIWRECFRVLKPGAFGFVMSAPRQDVLIQAITRLGEAGFNIKFTSIYWAYPSGFPKALNVSRMIDKRRGALRRSKGAEVKGNIFRLRKVYEKSVPLTDEAKSFEGSYAGFQPKPAVEVIITVMKPLSEKTFVDQAIKNRKAVSWFDDCRIPIQKGDEPHGGYGGEAIGLGPFNNKGGVKWKKSPAAHMGRFPANLLVSDGVLDTDTGSFSRYFDLDAWAVEKGIKETFPFLICSKPSSSEKNKGCDGLKAKKVDEEGDGYHSTRQQRETGNSHPTVKPIALMAYLITLGSRVDDLVLDPFSGSATTSVAAKLFNRRYIGIEKEKEYFEIAKKRLEAALPIEMTEKKIKAVSAKQEEKCDKKT